MGLDWKPVIEDREQNVFGSFCFRIDDILDNLDMYGLYYPLLCRQIASAVHFSAVQPCKNTVSAELKNWV